MRPAWSERIRSSSVSERLFVQSRGYSIFKLGSQTPPLCSFQICEICEICGLIPEMPKTPPKKRTAQIVPKQSTKKHAAIVKKVPPTTLITGGTGFLGAHLVRQLIDSGAKDLRVMATSIPEWLTGLGGRTIDGKETNAENVARAIESVT